MLENFSKNIDNQWKLRPSILTVESCDFSGVFYCFFRNRELKTHLVNSTSSDHRIAFTKANSCGANSCYIQHGYDFTRLEISLRELPSEDVLLEFIWDFRKFLFFEVETSEKKIKGNFEELLELLRDENLSSKKIEKKIAFFME